MALISNFAYFDLHRERMACDVHRELQKDMDALLNSYFHENVQLSQIDAEKRRDIAFPNVEKILAYINDRDPRFGKVPSRVGSYWQGLKVKKADEFDYSVILEGLDNFHLINSGPRYYNFNKPIDPDHQTIPQDLDVVITSVPLPSPPKGYHYVSDSPNSLSSIKGWTDISDLTRRSGPNKVDFIPFLVRRRLKQLLTEAKRDLNLRGKYWLVSEAGLFIKYLCTSFEIRSSLAFRWYSVLYSNR